MLRRITPVHAALLLISACAPSAPEAIAPPGFELDVGSRAEALHCLVEGQTMPPIDQLADTDLDTLTRLLGGVIATYRTADFDLFLDMRRPDVGFANRTKRAAELAPHLLELGASAVATHASWTDGLQCFWHAYYDRPPVARILPEATRARFQRVAIRADDLDAWEESFGARASGRTSIEHALVIPHRRELAEMLQPDRDLAVIELELTFELAHRQALCAHLRYVRDSIDGDWFLHRAITRLERGSRVERSYRNLIL